MDTTKTAQQSQERPRVGASAAQVAARFGVTTKSVRRWVNTGRIPAFRVGSHLRFDLDAVEAALAVGKAA